MPRVNRMKRLLLSIAGGIFLPILYLLLVWLTVSVVKAFNVTAQGDSWWFLTLTFPLEWGGRLYTLLFPPHFEKPFALLRGPAILLNILGSFLFFMLITYIFLWWRSRSNRLA